MPGLVAEIRTGLQQVFKTRDGAVVVFPGSGTGAWEASLVNTLSPGDPVLAIVNGHFSALYAEVARRMGMAVDEVEVRWGDPVPPRLVGERLRAEHRAVLVVHNETSTAVTSDIGGIRGAIDASGHSPLLLIDVVSSLASIDFRFDEWGVDVALTGSQKGLMLPPGVAILCLSERAQQAAERNATPRYFYDWRPVVADMQRGYFPYTPATLLLFGLREALRMLLEEGLDNVFARHRRLAHGVRLAVAEWDLPLLCQDPRAQSNSLTAVVTEPLDSDRVVQFAAQRLNLALGVGLGQAKGKLFRLGHLGSLNELEIIATLAGTEMAIKLTGGGVRLGAGVSAAQRYFTDS